MITVLEKLDMEYEVFYMKMMSQSKADIYARSDEIELKKSIYCYLRQNIVEDIRLLTIDCIIDEVYRKVMDDKFSIRKEDQLQKRLEKIVKNTISSHTKDEKDGANKGASKEANNGENNRENNGSIQGVLGECP